MKKVLFTALLVAPLAIACGTVRHEVVTRTPTRIVVVDRDSPRAIVHRLEVRTVRKARRPVRKDPINPAEARRLARDRAELEAARRKARADGRITRQERARIEALEDKLARDRRLLASNGR